MTAAWTGPQKPIRKVRVLVVDNDALISETNARNLADWGFEPCVAAGRGRALLADARKVAEEMRCQMATVDIHLINDRDKTDFSGVELVQYLIDTACIIVSGTDDPLTATDALKNSRAKDYFSKEGKNEDLRTMLERVASECSAAHHGARIEWPPDLSAEKVYTTLLRKPDFAPDCRFADQVEDVLVQLFPHARRLKIEMVNGLSRDSNSGVRAHSIVLAVSADERNQVVVKLARRSKVNREFANYRNYIENRLGDDDDDYSHLEDVKFTWEIGAARFSRISPRNARLFSRYYQESSIREIRAVLDLFFSNTWGGYYRREHQKDARPLFAIYCDVLGSRWAEDVKGISFERVMQGSPFDWRSLGLYDPIDWFKTHTESLEGELKYGVFSDTLLEITHGDLHGDNLFVDSANRPRVIDFERTGKGHILQDCIELEGDIINRLAGLGPRDWHDFYRLCVYSAQPKRIGVRTGKLGARASNLECASQVIAHLRSLAKDLMNASDARPYLWGLYFNTLFRARLLAQKQDDQPGLQRALIFASILSHRLDHYDQPWPPAGWPSIETAETGMQNGDPDHA